MQTLTPHSKTLSEKAFRDCVMRGNIPSSMLWIGKEDFLKSEALAFLKGEASKHGFCIDDYSVNETSPSELLGRAATASILCPKSLVILRDIEHSVSSSKTYIDRYLDNPFDDVNLVLISSAGSCSEDPFVHRLSSRAIVINFCSLVDTDLLEWARTRAEGRGVAIKETILKSLISIFPGQLSRLASEIDKLVLLHDSAKIHPTNEELETFLVKSVPELAQRVAHSLKNGNLIETLTAWKQQRLWDRPENILTELFYEPLETTSREEEMELLYYTDVAIKTGLTAETVLIPLMITQIIHPLSRIKEVMSHG